MGNWRREQLVLFASHILTLKGRNLRGDPLVDRRRRLQDLIGVEIASCVHFSPEHEGDGPAFSSRPRVTGEATPLSKEPDVVRSGHDLRQRCG